MPGRATHFSGRKRHMPAMSATASQVASPKHPSIHLISPEGRQHILNALDALPNSAKIIEEGDLERSVKLVRDQASLPAYDDVWDLVTVLGLTEESVCR
jgi:hypothetical protein